MVGVGRALRTASGSEVFEEEEARLPQSLWNLYKLLSCLSVVPLGLYCRRMSYKREWAWSGLVCRGEHRLKVLLL